MGGKFSIIYGDEFLSYDFGEHHPLRQFRVKLAIDLMKELGVTKAPGVNIVPIHKSTVEDLLLFHTEEYVEFVRASCEANAGWLDDGDTPAIKGCFEAALYPVGASIDAVRAVWRGKTHHAYNLGGGLHHAHRNRASGFCVFNDIAIAISYLKKELGAKRIAYIDIDAHQGDGVMYGFYNDPTILNIDFHEDGRYLFPGTGKVTELGDGTALNLKVNVPFPPYSADYSFTYTFRQLVPPLIRKFEPEIILMQTGVDCHLADPLTHMNLSYNSYIEVVRIVHNLAHEVSGGKLAMFGGGGYNPAAVAIIWTLMAAAIAGVEVSNTLPEPWRAELTEMTGVPAPRSFNEEHTDDQVFSEVLDTVYWLRNKLLMT